MDLIYSVKIIYFSLGFLGITCMGLDFENMNIFYIIYIYIIYFVVLQIFSYKNFTTGCAFLVMVFLTDT